MRMMHAVDLKSIASRRSMGEREMMVDDDSRHGIDASFNQKQLIDLGDDDLALVLSFLTPSEIGHCACINRRLRGLCKDDSKVWLQMCERSWGSRTSVKRWGDGEVPLRLLYAFLMRWEKLVGFWRGIGSKGRGCLVDFEWGSHFIKGFKVLPVQYSGYGVCKIPFLWIGISADGTDLCFMDRVAYKDSCSSSVSIDDPFEKLGFDADAEKLGLAMVDVHFIGKNHLLMEEVHQHKMTGKRLSLAEAATETSFGSTSHLMNTTRDSRVADLEVCKNGCSPPGSFPYEMYQFLASKVTSAGGDRASRRQMRRDRLRALSQGKQLPEPEHFVKVLHCTPTDERPLQGLWKGLCHCMNLDFILLSYDEQGGIVCRKIKECSGTTSGGPVYWTARPPACNNAPLSSEEQDIYNNRLQVKPRVVCMIPETMGVGGPARSDYAETFIPEEVVGMFRVTPDNYHCCFLSSNISEQYKEGRVWLYESGRFGFGVLHSNFIIDFRPITSRGCLLDVVEN